MYTILASLVSVLGFVIGPIPLQGTPTDQQQLVPRVVPIQLAPGEPTRFFEGVIYPSSSADGMVFEVDAPMTTSGGNNYYGIGLNLRTMRQAGFELTWRREGSDVAVSLVGSANCSDPTNPAQSVMVNLGRREALRQTGRPGPGAGLQDLQNRIDGGEAIFYDACNSRPVTDGFERQINILIPERLIPFGGELLIRARYQASAAGLPGLPNLNPAESVLSEPLVLRLRRNPPKMLVLGDSVAWGQGVGGLTASNLVFQDIVRRYRRGEFITKAHSGATVNEDSPRIADVNPRSCLLHRDAHGEIPRTQPTVQCQILDAVTSQCAVETASIGRDPIPHFFCEDGLPARRAADGETTFAFDLGPAYDVVTLWACINDVGAIDVVTGIADITNAELVRRTNNECNLRNGLEDVRAFLPNANIAVNAYHRIVSNASDVVRSNCTTQQQQALLTAAFPLQSITAAVAQAASAQRALTFQTRSTIALQGSVNAINQTPLSRDRLGRGALVFVAHPFFTANTAFWGPDPLVFGWRCNNDGILAPTDPVRFERAAACARFYGVPAADPFRLDPNPMNAGFMQCGRASAFHPNQRGNLLMGQSIVGQRSLLYPRMLSFGSPPSLITPNP